MHPILVMIEQCSTSHSVYKHTKVVSMLNLRLKVHRILLTPLLTPLLRDGFQTHNVASPRIIFEPFQPTFRWMHQHWRASTFPLVQAIKNPPYASVSKSTDWIPRHASFKPQGLAMQRFNKPQVQSAHKANVRSHGCS